MIEDRFFRVIIFFLFCLLAVTHPVFAADLYSFSDETGSKYYTNVRRAGYVKVKFPLAKEKTRQTAQLALSASKGQDYESLILQAGKTHSVDPDLVRAVIKAESNFNPLAVSPKGAQGLMQLMPQTATELGVTDPFDPASNINGGTLYLSRLLDILEGNLPLSLAAYNAGLNRVIAGKEVPAIHETKNYVKRVMNYYAKLKGI